MPAGQLLFTITGLTLNDTLNPKAVVTTARHLPEAVFKLTAPP